jgi:hypothetical protein
MAIEVVNLTEADIPGAIQVIQQAFADDPYFKWVFDEQSVCMLCNRKLILAPFLTLFNATLETNIISLP